MVTIKELEKLGVKLAEGVEPAKAYPVCAKMNLDDVKEIVGMFTSRGYDLNSLHLASFRLFTLNKKELNALKEVLDKIDELKLQEVFNSNLNMVSLRSSVIARVEICLNNGIPFVYEESNILIGELYSEESFIKYTSNSNDKKESVTVNETDQNVSHEEATQVTRDAEIVLDEEDNAVRSELIKILLDIKEDNKDNFTFGFLVTSIIANLDIAIANDNKNYRTLGTRHLIERALTGITLTPEMQNDVNDKILIAFTNNDLAVGRSA